MRVLLAVMLLLALVSPGCASRKSAPAAPAASADAGAGPAKTELSGIVSRVEPVGRFVVLTFPPDQMPAVDQHLGLYRHGAKVSEVKVAGPQRGNNIIADIVTGQPEVGDEARMD